MYLKKWTGSRKMSIPSWDGNDGNDGACFKERRLWAGENQSVLGEHCAVNDKRKIGKGI